MKEARLFLVSMLPIPLVFSVFRAAVTADKVVPGGAMQITGYPGAETGDVAQPQTLGIGRI